MHLRFVQVDAFTSAPFAGNPAAIFVLSQPIADARMQQIASEMNLSETAFIQRRPSGGFDLRWFTPTVEIDLCGHATLAGAHALWESGQLGGDQRAAFHTRSGLLTAEQVKGWIEMDFPSTPHTPADLPDGMAAALGVNPMYVGRSQFDYLVEVSGEDVVRQLRPDFDKVRDFPGRGVMITSRASTADVDFVSRFFAPAAGIDEDPVTGSAHCCLTPFWSSRLNKTDLIAHQLSARGGALRLRLDGDRVKISGQAVTVLRGEVLV